MDQATICRKMAAKWLEIARQVENPGLRKCYEAKAMRYRAMVALHEPARSEARSSLGRGTRAK